MQKSLITASILALSVAVAPACASKKFVRGEVGQVNSKVDTLSRSLEETQERTKANEARIGEVDQKVGVADQKAVAAGPSRAGSACRISSRASPPSAGAKGAHG